MIKVLHVVSSLGGGGVENMLYNYYSIMDRSEIRFDIIVHGEYIGILEEKFLMLGSKVFHVTPKKDSIRKNITEINTIIKNGKYDAIHCHQNFSNFSTLLLAKKNYVPVRISHAHGCSDEMGLIERVKNSTFRLLNKYSANYFFSCGINAAKWLHGIDWVTSDTNILMNNAINIEKFSYDVRVRNKYREELNINDKIALLHVGRFSDEKNHLFIIELFEELISESENYILMLAGNGPLEETVRKSVVQKGLAKNVRFLGVRTDIAELMNASDLFLLPSKNEGFPVTLVEAQSTGMLVFTSNKVTKETAITDLVRYLPIEKAEDWVNVILEVDIAERKSRGLELKKEGYSIFVQAAKYQKWLEENV